LLIYRLPFKSEGIFIFTSVRNIVGMIEGKVYKGIEYIQISDLTSNEQTAIKQWLASDTIIKIQTEKELLTDCIQFKDYKFWVENTLTSETPKESVVKTGGRVIKPFGFALDN